MYGFDPYNNPMEQQRRAGILVGVSVMDARQGSLSKRVDAVAKSTSRGKKFDPQFLYDQDNVLTLNATIERRMATHRDELWNAISDAVREGALKGDNIPKRPTGLGVWALALPIITGVAAIALIGGFFYYFVTKAQIDAIEETKRQQDRLDAMLKAIEPLSAAYTEFYKRNPDKEPPSPAQLLAMFPTSTSGGTFDKVIGFGTLALIVGGIYLASKTFGGSRS